jgi:hypothetical protein
MTNLLEQAINCDDADRAAKMIQDARGIESDNVVNYCLPKEWPRRGIWPRKTSTRIDPTTEDAAARKDQTVRPSTGVEDGQFEVAVERRGRDRCHSMHHSSSRIHAAA